MDHNEDKLRALHEQLAACRHCQAQFGYEPHPIVWGAPGAKIMQISQAPSLNVHELGRPFADLSGKRLRQQWYWVSEEQFYDKSLFYITTVGHCFPGKGRNNYDKKPPRCCYEMWTRKEIELMDSCELYILVGQEAASRIFPGRKLSDLAFEDLTLNGKPCFVLPHPSPLNRKWFMDHPAFLEERMPKIRKAVHDVIGDGLDLSQPYKPVSRETWQIEKDQRKLEAKEKALHPEG